MLQFPRPRGKKKRKALRREGMDPDHLANIRRLPSCISGRMGCQAHHLRIADERGVAMKATDRWAVPLTWEEHLECHGVGGKLEEEWFAQRGVDIRRLAMLLWENKRSPGHMRQIIEGRGQCSSSSTPKPS